MQEPILNFFLQRPRKERVETPEDDENEGDEFDNADDNSKCGPECQCNSKTLNELKAGMPGPAWHAMTCFIRKFPIILGYSIVFPCQDGSFFDSLIVS